MRRGKGSGSVREAVIESGSVVHVLMTVVGSCAVERMRSTEIVETRV
jgi:hypothetical protein